MPRSTRRSRRLALPVAALLGAGFLLFDASPAQAHTGTYTAGSDTTSQDSTVTATDGTALTIRLYKPTQTAPGGGWPIVVYKMGTGESRCSNEDFMTRKQLVESGYAVVSMTGRGEPGKYNANAQAGTGTGQCGTEVDAIKDSINDSGDDYVGPKDLQDVKDVISWAVTQTGLSTTQVGFLGHSLDGPLALLLAKNDSRVDAVVAGAGLQTWFKGNNINAISNKPLAPFNGYGFGFTTQDMGLDVHSDPSLLTSWSDWAHSRFLNTTPASATTTWMNDRTMVDDDSAVDKAHLITTPTFVIQGFRDNLVSPENAIQAFNKLPSGSKYLYLGACNSHGNACGAHNATWLRNKVVSFFDKYLWLDSVTMGGPIFFAVPPANLATDDWACDSGVSSSCSSNPIQTASSWPPPALAGTPLTMYLRSSGVLSTTAPTTTETPETITAPIQANPNTDLCTPTGYASGEYATYTTSPINVTNAKMVGIDADMYVSSSNDRLQVFVDTYEYNPSTGIETSITPSVQVVNIPTSYGQAANTHVHFQFKPETVGRTWTYGNEIRIKVASNVRGIFAMEPYGGTYSIHHSVSEPSKITMTFAA